MAGRRTHASHRDVPASGHQVHLAFDILHINVPALRIDFQGAFARGVNLLARQARQDFFFLLNPDSELQEGCLERLVERAQSDPNIGIAEARQSPREHPKTYDSATGETTWCSCAAALIRRRCH